MYRIGGHLFNRKWMFGGTSVDRVRKRSYVQHGDYQAAIEDTETAIQLNSRDCDANLSREKVEADSRDVKIGSEPKQN